MEIRRSQAAQWVRYAVAVGLVSDAGRMTGAFCDLEYAVGDYCAINAFCCGCLAKSKESPMLTCLSRKY